MVKAITLSDVKRAGQYQVYIKWLPRVIRCKTSHNTLYLTSRTVLVTPQYLPQSFNAFSRLTGASSTPPRSLACNVCVKLTTSKVEEQLQATSGNGRNILMHAARCGNQLGVTAVISACRINLSPAKVPIRYHPSTFLSAIVIG